MTKVAKSFNNISIPMNNPLSRLYLIFPTGKKFFSVEKNNLTVQNDNIKVGNKVGVPTLLQL